MSLYILREILFYILTNKKDDIITLQIPREAAQQIYKELTKLYKEDKI